MVPDPDSDPLTSEIVTPIHIHVIIQGLESDFPAVGNSESGFGSSEKWNRNTSTVYHLISQSNWRRSSGRPWPPSYAETRGSRRCSNLSLGRRAESEFDGDSQLFSHTKQNVFF